MPTLRVNALLPLGGWQRKQIRAEEPAASKAKMCVGLWGKATSVLHAAQTQLCVPPAFSLPLLRTPRPCFPLSALCPIGFISVTRYFKASLGAPGFSASAESHRLCPRSPRPLAHVWQKPSPVPTGSPWGSGKSCSVGSSPLPFLSHLQIPAVTEDPTQPGAAARAGLTRGARGAPGGPRWSRARRWRIFGAHCAA